MCEILDKLLLEKTGKTISELDYKPLEEFKGYNTRGFGYPIKTPDAANAVIENF
jgi:hypothetical protein